MNINEVIKYPILSEKTYKQMPNGVYTFAIDYRSKKVDLKKAVEIIFNVKISKINIQNPPRRDKRMGKFVGKASKIKKGIVFLQDGHSINYFPNENVANQPSEAIANNDKNIVKAKTTVKENESKLTDVEKRVAEKIKAKEKTHNIQKNSSNENNDKKIILDKKEQKGENDE